MTCNSNYALFLRVERIIIAVFCLLFLGLAQVSFAHDFYGRHVFGELYGVDPKLLNDPEFLEETLKKGITDSGATFCSSISKKFDPEGVTILILIAESHVSIHTYPEYNAIFFDAFTCGECDPMFIAEALIEALKPNEQNLQVIRRGLD